MNVLQYYFYYFSSIYAGYPLVIKMAVTIVMILLFLCLLSIFRLFIVRYKLRRKNRREKKIKKRYSAFFEELLYFTFHEVTEDDLDKVADFKMPKRVWEKRMVTHLILGMKKDKSYEEEGGIFNRSNYFNLLQYMKLLDFWTKRVASNNTNRVIKALRIVNEIGGGINGAAFVRSIYDRKNYLRKFARVSFTRFDVHNPYRFLDEGFDKSFNKFDEKRLHFSLIELAKEHPVPPLTKWIRNTEKESFAVFLISEIGFFGQKEAVPFLLNLFKETKSIPIQCQIAKTLGVLNYEPVLEDFVKEFKYSSQDLQSCILTGAGLLKTGNKASFFNYAYQHTQYNEIKVMVVELLKELGEQGYSTLVSLAESPHSDFEKRLFTYALH